jgi:hypothetical protein
VLHAIEIGRDRGQAKLVLEADEEDVIDDWRLPGRTNADAVGAREPAAVLRPFLDAPLGRR